MYPEGYTSIRIPDVTHERLTRIANFKKLPLYVVIDRGTRIWEANLLTVMKPAEQKRYLAGRMDFNEAEQITLRAEEAVRLARQRNGLPLTPKLLPDPDEPVAPPPAPDKDATPARAAEPAMAGV
jgi:hypothetical protein